MTLKYEHRLLISYAANIAKHTSFPSNQANQLLEEVASGSSFSEIRECNATKHYFASLPVELSNKYGWRKLKELLEDLKRVTEKIPFDAMALRIRELGRLMELSDEDTQILEAFQFIEHSGVEDFICSLQKDPPRRRSYYEINLDNNLIPHALGMSIKSYKRRLRWNLPLVSSGLLTIDEDDGEVNIADRLSRLRWNTDEVADVRELLLGKSETTDLKWSDYDYLRQKRDDVESIMRGAMERGTKGVNILLYGPAGAGKTSFCKVLAQRLGMSLFSIGESDDRGNEPTRNERLSELRLSQNLLKDDRNALLMLDEMEDVLTSDYGMSKGLFGLFAQSRRSGGSKVYLNRLLENAPVPTIWIVNEAGFLDDPIVRRMVLAVEFQLPPTRTRADILTGQLTRHGMEISDDDALSIAEQFAATPGVVEGAALAGELGGGDIELVRRSMKSLSKVLGCDNPRALSNQDFDLHLANADVDLITMTENLVKSGTRRFSLCLQGPPGTGKSAFVRYLARQIGMEVHLRRASDLFDMFVGQTERNIAKAFDKAIFEEAFLVFDEADSLLVDRSRAVRSWEISQVNEMLTWMESHPLPFACTTNHADLLDAATLRRFTFKVTFDYMRPEQVATAFRKWFKLTPPQNLAALDMLTPADFEVVRRKAEVLGKLSDSESLVAMLIAECEIKPGSTKPFGFADTSKSVDLQG